MITRKVPSTICHFQLFLRMMKCGQHQPHRPEVIKCADGECTMYTDLRTEVISRCDDAIDSNDSSVFQGATGTSTSFEYSKVEGYCNASESITWSTLLVLCSTSGCMQSTVPVCNSSTVSSNPITSTTGSRVPGTTATTGSAWNQTQHITTSFCASHHAVLHATRTRIQRRKVGSQNKAVQQETNMPLATKRKDDDRDFRECFSVRWEPFSTRNQIRESTEERH